MWYCWLRDEEVDMLKRMIAGIVCMNQMMRMNVSAVLALCLVPWWVHAGQSSLSAELRQPGKPALKVRMTEPVVVAVASRPGKWGFFQFPSLARWEDGTLAASWSLAADSIVSYGIGQSGSAIFRDGGKTWTDPNGQKGVTGLLLSNGDRIQVLTPKAIKTSELRLPKPAGGTGDTYSKAKQTLYRRRAAARGVRRLPFPDCQRPDQSGFGARHS